ncbi:MAG: STAS domain-containing protein [Ilumatobacteraceae bacterium]
MTETGNNESLTVEIDSDGIVVVHGDIDIAGGPKLDAVLLSRENTGQIVIDLGDVYFIDSSGLRSLLGASRRAQARNSMVVLRTVGPEVARLLQITGTTDQFTIESNRD